MSYAPRHARHEYRLAKNVQVRKNGIEIDGEEFPYHICIDGPVIERSEDDPLATLWIPVVVDVCNGGVVFGDN